MSSDMKGWNELGVVGTIYEEEEEEEEEENSASLSALSTVHSSPSNTPWASRRMHDTDVVIHVQGSCFHLHKQALIAKSAYLKRQLAEIPEITLSPPLNVTAETFALVAEFCYGNHVAVTPFTMAGVRTAAELLGMTAEAAGRTAEGDSLQEITDAYFRRVVGVSKECVCIVLNSCFSLLPEAETAASLVSRCVQALTLTAGDDEDEECLKGFKNVRIEHMKLILEAVSQRLMDCHDIAYKIIDVYLKENMGGVWEEAKIEMCNYIDCSILSPPVLLHALQNPRMPLRFVVQAMFLQQLHTPPSIISAAAYNRPKQDTSATTLGAILQRDAALRQVSKLRDVMNATNSRIQSLEEELDGMRKLLAQPDNRKNLLDSTRSASSRFSSEARIERGQMGSISSLSCRDASKKVRAVAEAESSLSERSSAEVKFGRRLINGIKSAFGLQKKKGAERKRAVENGAIYSKGLVKGLHN